MYRDFVAHLGLSIEHGVSDEGEGWFAGIHKHTGHTMTHGFKSDGMIYYVTFDGSGREYSSMQELISSRQKKLTKPTEMQEDVSRNLQTGWKPVLVGKSTGT